MADLFVYGTLRDRELLARIAGDGKFAAIPAILRDHRVLRQAQADLPYLTAAAGHTCEGLVLRGLSAWQQMRLDAYEAPFDYAAKIVRVVADGSEADALAYFPGDTVQPGADDWSLRNWTESGAPLARAAAQEIGSYDPPLPSEALKAQWKMINTRAAGRLRAAQNPAPATVRRDAGAKDVTVLGQGPLWGDFFKAGNIRLRHTTFQDTQTETLVRECFQATDAAILLPYDPLSDHVLLVEQIRIGPIVRGATNPWSLEPVAGMVDGDESPEVAALREAEEEAGLTGVTLEKMFAFYASPGNSTDYFSCFLGICALPQVRTYTGGLATEHEDLRLHILPFTTAFALIESGEANNGPLVSMLLWLDRNRDRLRALA